jgi:hypothetical protein
MRKVSFTILVLVMLATGQTAALGQQTPRTPEPPNTQKPTTAPKAARGYEQKEKEKEKPRPKIAPDPTPEPDEQEPDKPIEPLTMTLARGTKVGVTSKAVNIIVTGWDQDKLFASAKSENGPHLVMAETYNEPGAKKIHVYVPAARVRRVPKEITLEIKVPRYTELETVESNRGNIQVTNMEATVFVSSGTGSVSVAGAASAKISSRGGAISAKDVKGSLVVRTLQGSISANNIGGKVDVESANGSVSIRDAAGDLRANSMVGSLDIHCVKGRADITTASGSITIVGVGGDVDAQTTSGSVTFRGAIHNDGRYRLKSLAGVVEMAIQADAPGFNAALLSYSGQIETAFPIKSEAAIKTEPINRYIKGTYKGGGAQITLDSFNGSVRLVKAASGTLKECK